MSVPPEQQVINPSAWMALLADGRNRELCGQIIAVIEWYGQRTQSALDATARRQINDLLKLILSVITHPGFQVPDELAVRFIRLNRTLSNMLALSAFKTSDAQLAAVLGQPGSFAKVLALYSARNQPRDIRAALSASPDLAAAWYVEYASAFHAGLAEATVLNNLRAHLIEAPEDLPPIPGLQEVFFGSTYVDPSTDHLVKQRLNRALQRHYAPLKVDNHPNPRKIAVLSAYWRRVHSVYRTFYDFVQALKPDYHLTLFNLGNHAEAETSLFDEVRILPSHEGIPDPTALLNNDFQLLYYPDIGMCDESLILANMRLAPIQVTTIGHSVSTWGADIDYFISGAKVESPDHPEQFYSERLLLLPGMGCTHQRPNFPRPVTPVEPPADTLIINCPWSGPKINHPFLQTIARLLQSCRRPVRLQIFESGATIFRNDFLPFKEALAAVLPAGQWEVVINQPYHQYMSTLQAGHVALDSWHFGGCNTVSDSLFLGVPMVCWRGDRWYNRIGPHLLGLAGVPELIAENEAEYLTLAGRLIHDDAWRQGLRQRLFQADLAATVHSAADARHFKAAIDYLIAHHETLRQCGDRAPIRVAAE
jgi:hypothetical protein